MTTGRSFAGFALARGISAEEERIVGHGSEVDFAPRHIAIGHPTIGRPIDRDMHLAEAVDALGERLGPDTRATAVYTFYEDASL